jgi:hypothetical protein
LPKSVDVDVVLILNALGGIAARSFGPQICMVCIMYPRQ